MRHNINPREFHVKRSLENRTILCADCDRNRILEVCPSGRLVCASCGSKNWMFVAVPLIPNFKGYSEREAQERAAVDRYIAWLEKEEFFTSRDALL